MEGHGVEKQVATTSADRDLALYAEFCSRFMDDGSGGEWTLDGREYVLDEIWRPLVGFRVLPPKGVHPHEVCAACAPLVGAVELTERHTHPMEHDSACPGLVRRPLVLSAVNLPRRSGKTHSILSFAVASIFRKRHKRWAFIASAKDQADTLLESKVLRALERERNHKGEPVVKHLDPLYSYVRSKNRIEVPGKDSWIEVLPTSFGSITGRGYTGILVDEARDVPAEVAAKLMPSIFDCHGAECPKGHGHWQVPSPESGGTPPPTKCPKCGIVPERWYGRVLFASSSGAITDDPKKDWFTNFVAKRQERPHGNVYVFATGRTINPSVSSEIVDAVSDAFSDVDGINELVNIEATNISVRLGSTYLSKPDVEQVVDRGLRDRDESDRLAVWFLDASEKHDLTTLAVLTDDARDGEAAFARVAVQHLRIWNPRDKRDCPAGVVDDRAVEAYLEYLDARFPKMRRGSVDTRGMSWAALMMERAKGKAAWRRKAEAYAGKQPDDDAAYDRLRDYIVDKRIRIPDDPNLKAELLALKTVMRRHGGTGIVDPNANAAGRNRNKSGLHRDVSMAVAGAAFLAWEERTKALKGTMGELAAKANDSRALRHLKPIAQGKRER